MGLRELKEKYEKASKGHKLPSFSELNELFEIEKVDHEPETVLRAVRKVMMEKVINTLEFIEVFLNPVNVPRIYLPYLKNMGSSDREDMDKIYGELSALSLMALDNEVDYSEKAEAELIKDICSKWDSVKPSFKRILTNMKKPAEKETKKERSYYG